MGCPEKENNVKWKDQCHIGFATDGETKKQESRFPFILEKEIQGYQ
jgi:hypothetical protein